MKSGFSTSLRRLFAPDKRPIVPGCAFFFPCRFRAVNTEQEGISREGCHLPLANYMKLRLRADSNPT